MINDFSGMKERESYLYGTMWENFDFNTIGAKIEKTNGSNNSYCFAGNEATEDILVSVFDIAEDKLFKEKYEMVTSGSGDEGSKIRILRSSSLCALLHFYNVNGLILDFETSRCCRRKVIFEKSYFEYKSKVIKNPSNMDIVLIGRDIESKEKVVVFLESKFSEYYIDANGKCNNISKRYLELKYGNEYLYKKDLMDSLEIDITKTEKDFNLTSKEMFYVHGIKQLLSHYVGIRNVCNEDLIYKEPIKSINVKDKQKRRVREIIQNEVNAEIKACNVIILGEIVFDPIIGNQKCGEKKCFDIYKEKYEILAKHLALLSKDEPRLEIISKELGYSLFVDKKPHVERNVRLFYQYDRWKNE